MSRAGSNPAPAEKTCLYDGSSPQNVARAATASSFKVDIVADRVTSRPSTVRFRRVPSGGVKNAFTSLAAGGQQRLADLPSRDRQRRVAGDRGRRQLDAMHAVKRKAPGLTKAEPKARKVGTVPEDELAPLLVRARRDRYPFDLSLLDYAVRIMTMREKSRFWRSICAGRASTDVPGCNLRSGYSSSGQCCPPNWLRRDGAVTQVSPFTSQPGERRA